MFLVYYGAPGGRAAATTTMLIEVHAFMSGELHRHPARRASPRLSPIFAGASRG